MVSLGAPSYSLGNVVGTDRSLLRDALGRILLPPRPSRLLRVAGTTVLGSVPVVVALGALRQIYTSFRFFAPSSQTSNVGVASHVGRRTFCLDS